MRTPPLWWESAVGRRQSVSRVFRAPDVAAYDSLVPDDSPPGTVPEPLVAGLFSKLLGVDLPGPGTNYLKQELDFSDVAVVGEELTATVVVERVVPDKRLVYLATSCTGRGGRAIATGRALVLSAADPDQIIITRT
jgi:hypothetical protein